MRFHLGTTEAQAAATPSGDNFESDWTASLVAPPSGWDEFIDDGQTYAYTATGAYFDNNGADFAGIWNHTVSRSINAVTIIIAYNLLHDNWSTSLQINDGGDGISDFNGYETTGDTGFYSMNLDQIGGWTGSFASLTGADPEGFVVLAGVMYSSGRRTFYRFDDDGAVTVGDDAGTDPGTHAITNIGVVMQNYDFSGDLPGTAGAVRVARTYIGYDEELSLGAITAIASGWGWS